MLYPPLSRLGWKRKASLAGLTADPFTVTLSYPGPETPSGVGEGGKLATYTVTGLRALLDKHGDEITDVVARFALDSDGFSAMMSAEAVRVFNETEMVSKTVPDEDAGALLGITVVVVLSWFVCSASIHAFIPQHRECVANHRWKLKAWFRSDVKALFRSDADVPPSAAREQSKTRLFEAFFALKHALLPYLVRGIVRRQCSRQPYMNSAQSAMPACHA